MNWHEVRIWLYSGIKRSLLIDYCFICCFTPRTSQDTSKRKSSGSVQFLRDLIRGK